MCIRDSQDRPDRQVNTRSNDHVGHPDTQHRKDRRVLNDQAHVPERCESIRRKSTEDRDDNEKHQEDLEGLRLEQSLDQAILTLEVFRILLYRSRALRRLFDGVFYCTHATPLSIAPVIKLTSSSIEVCDA